MDQYVHRDVWYEHVFAPNEKYDALTITILGVILPGLVKYLRGAVADHLPGGKYASLTPEEVAGVPCHNKFCERMFAYWKFLLTYMPNISDMTAEGYTLFAINKTSEWLEAQDEAARNSIITQSIKDVKALRQLYKERQQEIQCARRENLEKEREENARKERARIEEIEKLSEKIHALGGLWCSAEAVDEGLQRLVTGKRGDSTRQLSAIKDQINFRKKALQQTFDSQKATSFSQNGIAFSLDEMIIKIKQIIALKS